ncbi:inositol monophosphatase family protein [Rhodospirillum rubrum]|uniref:Inositol monophosphatase n=1 Tax=Rhodospirillum rubrum (strain ATCC 11170 / ATH 1.1.1 / DSM 467 / LMG 4362 / NCIMB 8255 / S1) TaxID=269796 RepID=Q2RTQ8_RHORT|nr:inositol monophosphatase family protein [Rhodospirillum rubrum]ABC22487.1 Inositol monophosphatase [Rhodospirillum rubrum ATCC 11170]AEO48205.1 inositol monophosphatase [Rhodospirillum rubrum F11]MBK5954071.1 inositol phosphatase [Rhodospirillum rubrum]QXG82118.1 inositol monophosphatase family protein [Rhodospirillum rubrum]
MLVDPDAVTALIRAVVDAEVLPRFRNLSAKDIHTKSGPLDLVTEADLRAEAVLSEKLCALLPGSQVVGEEAVHTDPGVLRRLGGDAPVWIIDPVDGTGNFARGDDLFGCIVALALRGETVMGWIDHCVERRTVCAVKGRGVRQGGQIRHLPEAPAADPAHPLAALRGHIGGRALMTALRPRVATITRASSAAHAYLALLSGQIDFAVFTRMKVWDHAAGILIHREAGGCARLISGEDYAPTQTQGMPLMARNEERWGQLAGIIRQTDAVAVP